MLFSAIKTWRGSETTPSMLSCSLSPLLLWVSCHFEQFSLYVLAFAFCQSIACTQFIEVHVFDGQSGTQIQSSASRNCRSNGKYRSPSDLTKSRVSSSSSIFSLRTLWYGWVAIQKWSDFWWIVGINDWVRALEFLSDSAYHKLCC